ncbi:MAG TPA: hypothetical protein VN612_08625 [Acidobacteriaceae bacterium]|nr:hypothetical protein [Acidobacteriaceae bacterium]
MKTSGTGRVLAILFIGVIGGIYLHFRQMRWLGRGRDAYLAAESQWFDNVSRYHSSMTMIIAGIILAVLAYGVYEIIAAGFTRLIPPSEVEE